MGVDIIRPPKKQEDQGGSNGTFGAVGRVVGAVGGAFAGNPMAGYQAGGQAGDMADTLSAKKPEDPKPQASGVQTSGGAMKRRLSSMLGDQDGY